MPQIVICASCNAKYDATGYRPGVQFACSRCQNLVQVPAAAPVMAASRSTGQPASGYDMDQEMIPTIVDPRGTTDQDAVPTIVDEGAAVKALKAVSKGKKSGKSRDDEPPKGKGKKAKAGKDKGRSRDARGGRRGANDEDDDRRGRGAPKKADNTLLIVVGAVVVLGAIGAIIAMSGNTPPRPANTSTSSESATDKKNTPTPTDEFANLRNNDAVRTQCEKFWKAIETGDQKSLDECFNARAFLAGYGKEDMVIDMGAKLHGEKAFIEEYFSAGNAWQEYVAGLTLTPAPTKNSKGQEFWYIPGKAPGKPGQAIVQYKAKPKAKPDAKEKTITLEWIIDPMARNWKLAKYADKEYKPWKPEMTVVFNGKKYEVPAREYFKHRQEYAEEKRMPPPPYDKEKGSADRPPSNDPGGSGANSNSGSSSSSSSNSGANTESSSSAVPTDWDKGSPSGWGADLVKHLENRDFNKAQRLCTGKSADKQVSLRLIYYMITANKEGTPPDQRIMAQEACKCLQLLYGGDTKGASYDFNAMDEDLDRRGEVIQRWIEKHETLFDKK